VSEQWICKHSSINILGENIINLVEDYSTESLCGLKIIISNAKAQNSKIVTSFGYSNSYRSFIGVLMNSRIKKIKEKNECAISPQNIIFEVINSDYLKEIIITSCGFVRESELRHFSFIAQNMILDVAASSEPKITEIKT
jgi:hypothetical protein